MQLSEGGSMNYYEAKKDDAGNWIIYQVDEEIAMVGQCPNCEANARKIAKL